MRQMGKEEGLSSDTGRTDQELSTQPESEAGRQNHRSQDWRLNQQGGEQTSEDLSRLLVLVAFLGVACFTATTPAFPLAHGLYDAIVPDLTSRAYFLYAGVTAMALSTLGITLAFFRPRRVHLGTRFFLMGGILSTLSFLVNVAVYSGTPLLPVQNLLGILGGIAMFFAFFMWAITIGSVRGLIASMRYVAIFMSLSLAMGALIEKGISLPGGMASRILATLAVLIGSFAPLVLVGLGPRLSNNGPLQGFATTLPSGAETFSLILGGLRAVRVGRQETGDTRTDGRAAAQAAAQSSSQSGAPAEAEVTGGQAGAGAALRGMLASFGAGAPMFMVGMPAAVFLLYASSFSALVPRAVTGPLPYFEFAVLGGCALILLSCLLRDDTSSVTFAFRVLLPVAGVLMLGVGNMLSSSTNIGVLALGAQGMCYAYGIAVCSIAVYAGSRRFQGAVQIMAYATSFSVAVVMMMPYFDVTLGDLSVYVKNFVVSILVLDLVFLIASPSVYAWRDILNLVEEPSEEQEGLVDRVREACERVAVRYGLTPRETEVMQYLGRGYGPSYLATVMPIKENTIRSHVRNIYSKLGVGSRAELLSLIDKEAGA